MKDYFPELSDPYLILFDAIPQGLKISENSLNGGNTNRIVCRPVTE